MGSIPGYQRMQRYCDKKIQQPMKARHREEAELTLKQARNTLRPSPSMNL